MMYDEIHLEGKDIVSDQYYKGLSYGSISNDALLQKEAIEKEEKTCKRVRLPAPF